MNKIFLTMLIFLSSIASFAQNPEELHFKDTNEKVYLHTELDSKPKAKEWKSWSKKFNEKYETYISSSQYIKGIKQKFALIISEEGLIKEIKLIQEDVQYFKPSYATDFAEENKTEIENCRNYNIDFLKKINLRWPLGYKNSVPVNYQAYVTLSLSAE